MNTSVRCAHWRDALHNISLFSILFHRHPVLPLSKDQSIRQTLSTGCQSRPTFALLIHSWIHFLHKDQHSLCLINSYQHPDSIGSGQRVQIAPRMVKWMCVTARQPIDGSPTQTRCAYVDQRRQFTEMVVICSITSIHVVTRSVLYQELRQRRSPSCRAPRQNVNMGRKTTGIAQRFVWQTTGSCTYSRE